MYLRLTLIIALVIISHPYKHIFTDRFLQSKYLDQK